MNNVKVPLKNERKQKLKKKKNRIYNINNHTYRNYLIYIVYEIEHGTDYPTGLCKIFRDNGRQNEYTTVVIVISERISTWKGKLI